MCWFLSCMAQNSNFKRNSTSNETLYHTLWNTKGTELDRHLLKTYYGCQLAATFYVCMPELSQSHTGTVGESGWTRRKGTVLTNKEIWITVSSCFQYDTKLPLLIVMKYDYMFRLTLVFIKSITVICSSKCTEYKTFEHQIHPIFDTKSGSTKHIHKPKRNICLVIQVCHSRQ
jgi:hypothetical protein